MLGRKQQSQVARSFPNRYLFSLTNKVTYLFPISCILEIILRHSVDTEIKYAIGRVGVVIFFFDLVFDREILKIGQIF